MYVHIDESGDPGTGGRGTKWLVLAAVCVPDAAVSSFDRDVERILAEHGKPTHFTRMNHDDKRGLAARFGATTAEWTGIVIGSDTQHVTAGSRLARPDYQYNYALRYLIERVSNLAASLGEEARIEIETRRVSRTNSPIAYIQYLESIRDEGIDWRHLKAATMSNVGKGSTPGICVADALAHASFRVLEPHPVWGHTEDAYLVPMAHRIWRADGRVAFGPGVTLMPTAVYPEMDEFFPMLRA